MWDAKITQSLDCWLVFEYPHIVALSMTFKRGEHAAEAGTNNDNIDT
jgi:hypothetical protein